MVVMRCKIESALVKHLVRLGWFVKEVIREDGMIMVSGHDGSEEELDCGLVWMDSGPHEFWIQRPSKGGHYVPYNVQIKL